MQTEHQREFRARSRAGQTKKRGSVTELSPEQGPGPVEQAVLNDTSRLSTAASNEALVQAALAMARILDNPNVVTTQPSAAAKLESIMERLRRGADTRKARLSTVRKMTSRAG